jgi:glycosyltransferase involved in cell wall biosynthesis
MTRQVHLIWPHDIDDPRRPSGGDRYDRCVATGLRARGWDVQEYVVAGPWPALEPAACARLARTLDRLPDGALVLIDGLVASATPHVLERGVGRLRLVVLVHLPTGPAGAERATLTMADRVVATSDWTARWITGRYGVGRVDVAVPGVARADPAPLRPRGQGLLAVGAVTAVKGYDVLVDALGLVADLPWRCRIVGAVDIDPAFAGEVRARARALGLDGRISWEGPCGWPEMASVYADADVLVAASRQETYGMAVTEALARGMPVIAPAVGGVPEAVGRTAAGDVPGLLVEPADSEQLARALRSWLTDAALRARLRGRAAERRGGLPDWEQTVGVVEAALLGAGRAVMSP